MKTETLLEKLKEEVLEDLSIFIEHNPDEAYYKIPASPHIFKDIINKIAKAVIAEGVERIEKKKKMDWKVKYIFSGNTMSRKPIECERNRVLILAQTTLKELLTDK